MSQPDDRDRLIKEFLLGGRGAEHSERAQRLKKYMSALARAWHAPWISRGSWMHFDHLMERAEAALIHGFLDRAEESLLAAEALLIRDRDAQVKAKHRDSLDSTKDKEEIRAIAEAHWRKFPEDAVADVLRLPAIAPFTRYYHHRTVHDWIKDLKPGGTRRGRRKSKA